MEGPHTFGTAFTRRYVFARIRRATGTGKIHSISCCGENRSICLSQPSHGLALRVLDEFLRTHAETLIRDPLKRAMLQRDLWALFDWSVQQNSVPGRPEYKDEKRALQARLAEVMRRLALPQEQIKSLPDNYAQAMASGAFAAQYDPIQPQRIFLPPDLFDPRGPWVCITPSPGSIG